MLSICGRSYKQIKEIGSGTFGIVYSVLRDDNKKFAFKKFKKDTLDLDIGVLREISILRMFQGNIDGVINLEDIIVLEDTIGIVMKEYIWDLSKLIENDILSKSQKKKIACKILQTVHFLHSHNIIHRDIKPENILLDENYNPVLADYSLSKLFYENSKKETHTSKFATCGYRSPEVISKKDYNLKVDSWSLGVVFYELFTGQILNFDKDIDSIKFLNIQKRRFKKTSLADLIKGLLIVNPNDRWSPRKALESDFFCYKPKNIHCDSNIKNIKVTKHVLEICKDLEYKKQFTPIAAQMYINKTQCSPYSAVELSFKINETEPYDYINEEYPEEELMILKRMNFNLFIQ